MIERLPHILDGFEWHPIVPKNAVRSIGHNTQPKILWIGKTTVESPLHGLTEFEEADCTPVEFHRYRGNWSWKVDSYDGQPFAGEVISDSQTIPAVVCLTGLGFGIRAIDRPQGAQFEMMQLRLPVVAKF